MGVKLKYREEEGRKGKWWVYIYHNKKQRVKCAGSNEKVAKAIAAKIQAKLTLGDLGFLDQDDKARRPFDTYFQAWLDTYAKSHCKESTVAGYETAFRLYLKPHFKQRCITEITRDDVKQLAYDRLGQKNEKGKTKSRSYVKGILAPLSEMFNHAIEDGHLEGVNPALRIFRRSRSEEGARAEKVSNLTREELQAVLKSCTEHFPEWHPFVLCLARTGLRIGEAIALQWGDLDFNGRFAEVKRNLVDGNLTTPKSGRSRRVDLSQQLTEVLKASLIERKKLTLLKGWGELPAWVFINLRGNPVDPDHFRKRTWPKILEKAKMRTIRIHDLRHTYASLLIQQGESLAYVKEQMGHHSIRVTVDTYGHLVPGGNKAAVDRLDDASGSTKPDQGHTSSGNSVSVCAANH